MKSSVRARLCALAVLAAAAQTPVLAQVPNAGGFGVPNTPIGAPTSSPTFTGTITMPDASTWSSIGPVLHSQLTWATGLGGINNIIGPADQYIAIVGGAGVSGATGTAAQNGFVEGGVGGNASGAGNTAGAGGLVDVQAGTGGNATAATGGVGGAGGVAYMLGGTGGNATGAGGTRTGGAGGNVILSGGLPGTGASANGAPGTIILQTNNVTALVVNSAAGTLTLPTLQFTNCGTNCGILAPAANQLEFSVNGGNVLDYAVTTAATWTHTGSVSATNQLISTVSTGTAPLVVSSTTNIPNLNASSLSGATMAAPGAIGGTTPNTSVFTTMTVGKVSTASGSITLTGTTSGTSVISVNATGGPSWNVPNNAGAVTGYVCYASTGTLITFDASTCTTSSERFKHDIVPIDDAVSLNQVLAFRPVTYEYNEEIGVAGRRIGLIAEEAVKVNPLLGAYDPDGNVYGIQWTGSFDALLIGAIKAQQAEIDALKRRLN